MTLGPVLLVTVIKFLPLTNKHPGADEATVYELEHQEVFQGAAHFLEINLLCGG